LAQSIYKLVPLDWGWWVTGFRSVLRREVVGSPFQYIYLPKRKVRRRVCPRQTDHVAIKMGFLGWGSLGLSHVREPRDLEHRCVGAPVWAPGAGGRAPMAAPLTELGRGRLRAPGSPRRSQLADRLGRARDKRTRRREGWSTNNEPVGGSSQTVGGLRGHGKRQQKLLGDTSADLLYGKKCMGLYVD
jgi:hypothetical protein